MNSSRFQENIEAIVELADEIARTSPESADRAMRIVALLRSIEGPEPDREAVQDAIEAQAVTDLSDVGARNAADAVLRTIREER